MRHPRRLCLPLLLLGLAAVGCHEAGEAEPFEPGPDGVWTDAAVVDMGAHFDGGQPHTPSSHALVHALVTNHGARPLNLYTTGVTDGYQFGPSGSEPGWFAFVVGTDTIPLASWLPHGDATLPQDLTVGSGETAEVVVATPSPWAPPTPGPPPPGGAPYVPSDAERAAYQRSMAAYAVAADSARSVPRLRRIAEGASLVYVERTSGVSEGLLRMGAAEQARVHVVLRLGRGAAGRASYERWDGSASHDGPFPHDDA